MFTTPACPAYAPVPITILDEEFACDDFHPAIFELAALRNYISAE
jgi:hypothetical protein